jgi:hypothetical protein
MREFIQMIALASALGVGAGLIVFLWDLLALLVFRPGRGLR